MESTHNLHSHSTKVTIAFFFILSGLVINSFPDKSISINIAKFIAWIFILIGQIKLINVLRGNGKIGAVLFLAGTLMQTIARVIGFFSFTSGGLLDMFMPNMSTAMNIMSVLDGGSTSPFDSFSLGDEYANPGPAWTSLLQNLFLIGAIIMWLLYEPFNKIKSALITLLVTYSILFLVDLPQIMGGDIPGMGILSGIAGFIYIIAFYKIVIKTAGTEKISLSTAAITLLYIGFSYTFLILADNGILVSVYIIAGAIIVLCGNNKIRESLERRGTGAFISYGVLAIIFGLIMMTPLIGGILATPIQLVSYIVLAIAFFRFGGNDIFDKYKSKGMILIGIVTLFNVVLSLIPTTFGVPAFIFCLIEVPLIIVSFVMAINSVQKVEEVEILDANTSTPEHVSTTTINNKPISAEDQLDEYRRFQPRNENLSNTILAENITPKPSPIPDPIQEKNEEIKESKDRIAPEYFWIGGVILVAIIGIISYTQIYKPYIREKNAPRMYTYANITNLRSSKVSGGDFNILAKLPYGAEVVLYEKDSEWSSIKCNDVEGFVSTYFLLPQDDFVLLNGMFGDVESRSCIESAKCKKALIEYYKQKGIYGVRENAEKNSLFSKNDGWQIFAKSSSSRYNSVAYPRIWNKDSKFTDFAVIITNIYSYERRFLLFSFDDITENAMLVHEDFNPSSGYIKDIRGRSYRGRAYVTVTYL